MNKTKEDGFIAIGLIFLIIFTIGVILINDQINSNNITYVKCCTESTEYFAQSPYDSNQYVKKIIPSKCDWYKMEE